ncbi:hypothetical protein GALL_296390 [mine drainage metagenome]|uniref:Uncharacterized protein n=1 Tax=mine drainage metagenome TaxID=410659 RepID=A0A1J5QXS5_9ZZZZ
MMMQTHIQRHRIHPVAFQQQLVAFRRMALHRGELLVRELPGLVEDFLRDHHLAEIMQQSGHARLAGLLLIEAKLTRQGDHQGANRHRMHVGVIILGLQTGQTDQGARATRHRVGNFLHQRHGVGGIQRIPHARLVEHGYHGFLGLGTDFCRLLQFLLDCNTFNLHRIADGVIEHPLDFNLDFGLLHGLAGRDIQALAGIDPDFADAAVLDGLDVLRIHELEFAAPERVIHP